MWFEITPVGFEKIHTFPRDDMGVMLCLLSDEGENYGKKRDSFEKELSAYIEEVDVALAKVEREELKNERVQVEIIAENLDDLLQEALDSGFIIFQTIFYPTPIGVHICESELNPSDFLSRFLHLCSEASENGGVTLGSFYNKWKKNPMKYQISIGNRVELFREAVESGYLFY